LALLAVVRRSKGAVHMRPAMPCDIKQSVNCQKFKGVKITNQSMHDASCSGHRTRLAWGESPIDPSEEHELSF
jgi:hypothetical protein